MLDILYMEFSHSPVQYELVKIIQAPAEIFPYTLCTNSHICFIKALFSTKKKSFLQKKINEEAAMILLNIVLGLTNFDKFSL